MTFIKGREIIDAVLVANEAVHSRIILKKPESFANLIMQRYMICQCVKGFVLVINEFN